MAVSGVRARNFIQPNPGGASAIFQRQRGMVAAAPLATPEVQGDPNEKESRMGKASGRDYAKFLGKNEGVIKGAVNTLKDLLVGTFIAAKSLGATLKAVVKQIKGMSGGGGGRGLFGTLGMIGLVGALIAGVAAIFGPQIQKAFEWLKGGADGIFQDLKGRLDGLDKRIENFYTNIQTYINVTLAGMIDKINAVIDALKPVANDMFHLPNTLGPFDISHITGPLKHLGKTVYALPQIPNLPKLPDYRDILGPNGINFLAQYNDVGALGGAMMSGAGSLAMGGIENTTGFFGDLINNLIASLGLTGQANSASNFLGMGNIFTQNRALGSGPGLPSLLNQGGGTTSGNYAPGAGGLTPQQRAFLETVSFAEGTQNPESYNTWFSGMKFPPEQPDLSKYTINQIVNLQRRFLAEGHGRFDGGRQKSAAVGKYQMIEPETYAAKAGLNPAVDKFTPENQDKMALYGYIMGQGGVTEAEINAPEISDQTIDKLAPVFASYPNLFGPGKGGISGGDGVSYYGGQGAKMKSQIKERHRNEYSAAMQNAQTATPPPASTKTTQPSPPPPPVVQPVSTTKTTQKKGTPISFVPLPTSSGQTVQPVPPRPTVAPRNPGGAGQPSYAFFNPSFPDNLGFPGLGVYST